MHLLGPFRTTTPQISPHLALTPIIIFVDHTIIIFGYTELSIQQLPYTMILPVITRRTTTTYTVRDKIITRTHTYVRTPVHSHARVDRRQIFFKILIFCFLL